MNTLKIKSTHNTLAEAVKESSMDLSYNVAAAERNIKEIEKDATKAFVMEDGRVLYIFHCDINILNEFQPFFGSMDCNPFYVFKQYDDKFEIITEKPISKSNRHHIRRNNLLVTCISE